MLSNFHKKPVKRNHCVNYISSNDLNYIIDITSSYGVIYNIKNGFAESLSEETNYLQLYNHNVFDETYVNYNEISPLTKEQQEFLLLKRNKELKKFITNPDMFLKFFLENVFIYQIINETYNKVYDEQKRLRLI